MGFTGVPIARAEWITPPVGFNLYVLQGMTGRNIFTIGTSALPLFALMCIAVVLVAMFPQLALWLPSTMLDAHERTRRLPVPAKRDAQWERRDRSRARSANSSKADQGRIHRRGESCNGDFDDFGDFDDLSDLDSLSDFDDFDGFGDLLDVAGARRRQPPSPLHRISRPVSRVLYGPRPKPQT